MPGKKRPYPWTCGRLGSIEKDEDQNTYGFSSGICTDLKEKFLNKHKKQNKESNCMLEKDNRKMGDEKNVNCSRHTTS